MSGPLAPPGHRLPRRFQFVRHLAVFGTTAGLSLSVETFTGSDWPLFWPLACWSILVALHYFVASAYELEGAWVDERITDLRSRSYDFDHIRNIEQRIRDSDASVTPHAGRDRADDGQAPTRAGE